MSRVISKEGLMTDMWQLPGGTTANLVRRKLRKCAWNGQQPEKVCLIVFGTYRLTMLPFIIVRPGMPAVKHGQKSTIHGHGDDS